MPTTVPGIRSLSRANRPKSERLTGAFRSCLSGFPAGYRGLRSPNVKKTVESSTAPPCSGGQHQVGGGRTLKESEPLSPEPEEGGIQGGGKLHPTEPNGGAHGATRTLLGKEAQGPPLPGCRWARRAGLSRGDVALHCELQGVGAHPHGGPQCSQQGGGGLVRPPGFEAAGLGHECVGEGEQEVSPPGSFGLAKPGCCPRATGFL